MQIPTVQRLLASVFPVTKQVNDCLHSHVIPILKQQVPDGSLSSGRPVWQDFAHFLPGVAGASGSFDAKRAVHAVLANAGTDSITGGLLGSLPILGPIVGSAPSGGGSLLGARPAWVGDLGVSVPSRGPVLEPARPEPRLARRSRRPACDADAARSGPHAA